MDFPQAWQVSPRCDRKHSCEISWVTSSGSLTGLTFASPTFRSWLCGPKNVDGFLRGSSALRNALLVRQRHNVLPHHGGRELAHSLRSLSQPSRSSCKSLWQQGGGHGFEGVLRDGSSTVRAGTKGSGLHASKHTPPSGSSCFPTVYLGLKENLPVHKPTASEVVTVDPQVLSVTAKHKKGRNT